MTSPAGRRASGLLPARKADYMHGRKTARSKVASPQQLDKMIEEATVDCYDEQEQASGFFTMIEDNLVFPFTARVFGIDVSVVGIEMDDDGSLKVVCEHGGERQLIGLTDLPLPAPPPVGAEWIDAYRRWRRGR